MVEFKETKCVDRFQSVSGLNEKSAAIRDVSHFSKYAKVNSSAANMHFKSARNNFRLPEHKTSNLPESLDFTKKKRMSAVFFPKFSTVENTTRTSFKPPEKREHFVESVDMFSSHAKKFDVLGGYQLKKAVVPSHTDTMQNKEYIRKDLSSRYSVMHKNHLFLLEQATIKESDNDLEIKKNQNKVHPRNAFLKIFDSIKSTFRINQTINTTETTDSVDKSVKAKPLGRHSTQSTNIATPLNKIPNSTIIYSNDSLQTTPSPINSSYTPSIQSARRKSEVFSKLEHLAEDRLQQQNLYNGKMVEKYNVVRNTDTTEPPCNEKKEDICITSESTNKNPIEANARKISSKKEKAEILRNLDLVVPKRITLNSTKVRPPKLNFSSLSEETAPSPVQNETEDIKKSVPKKTKKTVTYQGEEYEDERQINRSVLDSKRKSTRLSPVKSVEMKTFRFSWIVARALIKLKIQSVSTFQINGVPWHDWEFHQVPTIGYSPKTRVQEMYKAYIPCNSTPDKKKKVFIKTVPAHIWQKQWENQNRWKGEYVTDGENFVMEAAALSFLNQYGKNLTPELYAILELTSPVPVCKKNKVDQNNNVLFKKQMSSRFQRNEVTYIAIVSELYGMDLIDLVRKRSNKMPLTDYEKLSLQYECLTLLHRLHQMGLAHLDVTPENILSGKRGLRLCDFAKATPLHTNTLRHTVKNKKLNQISGGGQSIIPFESCEPTIGKGAYMPPECWKVHWNQVDADIACPLYELYSFTEQSERLPYYFNVESADTYMVGVLLFWLWSDGLIWQYSDVTQDEKYSNLVRGGLNLDLFDECRNWPYQLKRMLQGTLQPNPKERFTLHQLLQHAWFEQFRAVTARDRQPEKGMKSNRARTSRLGYYND